MRSQAEADHLDRRDLGDPGAEGVHESRSAETIDNNKLAWLVSMHVLFLGSLLAVVLAARWSESSKHPEEKGEPVRGR